MPNRTPSAARPILIHLRWDEQVRAFLNGLPVAPGWKAYFLGLWKDYLAADLAHAHFVRELTKGERGPFFQRVWEMMLARHLIACGYRVTSPSQDGRPDFRCEKDGQVLWVEATCVTEGQDPNLAPDADWRCASGYVPHDNILLRWTSACHAKIKQAAAFRRNRVIAPHEMFVIAINGASVGTGNYGVGVSQLPYVVESTMGVGPLQLSYDRKTLAFKGAEHQVRVRVLKDNQAAVATNIFYDQANAGISALIGCGAPRVEGTILPLLIAHNPLALSRLPPGQFGPDTREWAATLVHQDVDAADWQIGEIQK